MHASNIIQLAPKISKYYHWQRNLHWFCLLHRWSRIEFHWRGLPQASFPAMPVMLLVFVPAWRAAQQWRWGKDERARSKVPVAAGDNGRCQTHSKPFEIRNIYLRSEGILLQTLVFEVLQECISSLGREEWCFCMAILASFQASWEVHSPCGSQQRKQRRDNNVTRFYDDLFDRKFMKAPDWNFRKLSSDSVWYVWLKAPIPKCPKCLLSIWIAVHNAGSLHRCGLSVSFSNNALVLASI